MDRIIRIKLDSRQAEQGIDRLDNDMRGLGRTSDGIQTKLTAVASALAAAFSVQQIAAYADAYTNIQNRLRVVTDSTEQLTRVTASLLQTANDTRASFDATSSLYSTLARSTEELAISEERLIAITRTVNQSFAVSGASADEAANAIRQLAQGLSAGALRGDEFNSVAEQAPGILRAVAAETGKTTGELRAFAAEGGITAELLISAIENYSETVQTEFDKTNRTFAQSTVVARNNATAFIGSSELVKQATQTAGESLVFLSNNLEALSASFLVVAGVVAGRYVIALGAAAAATVASTAATVNATIAEAAQTQAAFFAANGIRVKDAVVRQATVSQVAYATALRASGAALSFLAGPAGLILLAASAFLIFANNSAEARVESEKSITVNELLTQSYEDMTQAQIKNTKFILGEKIAALEAEQAAIQKTSNITKDLSSDEAQALATFTGAKVGVDELGNAADSAQAKVDALQQNIVKLNERLTELDGKSTRRTLTTPVTEVAPTKAAEQQAIAPSVRSDGSAIADSLDTENALIDNALALRVEAYRTYGATINDINVGEFERQRALLELSIVEQTNAATLAEQSEIARIEARRQQIFENESLSAAERIEINRLLDEQLLLQEQTTQQSLTQINAEGAASRKQLAEAERQTRLMQLGQLGDSLMSLGQGQSKKVFEIGKKLALAQAAIALPTAVMESFKNGGGYPWGLVPAAAMAATGLKNIQNIRSTTYGGGGGTASLGSGGGGGGVGLGGGSTTLPTQPQGAQTVQTLEIRGLDEIRDELRNQDGMVSTRFVATILDKISDANRIRGEG